jgi:hypothetical protein
MKNEILNIGKALEKVEQKSIHGGGKTYCNNDADCCGVGNPIYQYACNGIVCIIGVPSPPCGFN